MSWFIELIRSFFFTLDSTLFNFIPFVYDILIKISRSSVLSQGNIQEIASRIQMLLGVFMLFKVTISLITYILNPDEFSDKGKGVSKLGFNIVFALVILVFTPYIFNAAYDLQGKILSENALATLIFGDNVDDNDYLLSAGDQMAFDIMLPFFMPDSSLQGSADHDYDLSTCGSLTDEDDISKFNTDCSTQMQYALNTDETDPNTMVLNYVGGYEHKSLGLMFRLDIAKAKAYETDNFLINYNIPLTTVVAVVVLLLLITFCMDVALRSIKLAFLQLIAPIPIISYIDPKNGKDGLFKKWYQMCLTTYLSLFVRLLALYFGVYIISIVGKMNLYDTSNNTLISDPFVVVFVIIGVLMFIKQLPKILEGLGIKLDSGSGKFTLNPFKKITEDAVGGKQLVQGGKGALATLGAAGLAGAVNTGSRLLDKNNKWTDSNGKFSFKNAVGIVGKAAGSGFAGAASATYRGAGKTIKGEKMGKIFADSYGEAMFAKLQREDNLRKAGLENASIGQRAMFGLGSFGADVARFTGNLNKGQREYVKADEYAKEIKSYQDKVDDAKRMQSELKKQKFEQLEKAQTIGQNIDTLVEMEKDVKAAKVAWENAKSRGESDATIKSLYDAYKERKGIALNRAYNDNNSVIHQQVELYNSIQKNLSAEQQSIVTHLDTNFTRNVNMDGKFVDTGSGIYSVMKDSSGTYYVDSSGVRHDENSWGAVTRFDVSSSGINNIGDNNDRVTQEKYRFETSGEYARLDADIKNYESKIDEVKNRDDYIVVQDENSIAKIQNASRWTSKKQEPGYKPAASPNVNPRGLNVSSNSIPVPPTSNSGNP